MNAVEAWKKYNDDYANQSDLNIRYRSGGMAERMFRAGYRRALEDAADEVAEADFNGFFDLGSIGVEQVRDWLRDTAAAAAPRETKD